MTWQAWVSLLAAAFALTAVVIAVRNWRTINQWHHGDTPGPGATTSARTTQVAFVINPTKPGVTALRDAVHHSCAVRYLPEPRWYETTPDDPGFGQARQALTEGADVVVAVGGDGTVRSVARALVRTNAAMALIPLGTGNLLARNLDLPLGDLGALVDIALAGPERQIDVGWLTLHDPGAERRGSRSADDPRHIFLVIGGLGFDAAMVGDTNEDLKARVGWVAYFFAGARHLHARRLRVEAQLDDGPWYSLRLRSLLIGNCGRLPGGITLLPDAKLDDGWLDVGAIDTRAGMLGWTQLFGTVVAQRFGVRAEVPGSIGQIEHARARQVNVRSREAQQIQVDGDVVGRAHELTATVDYRALTVRVA